VDANLIRLGEFRYESVYRHALDLLALSDLVHAEVRWLSAVIDDLKSGKLSWDHGQIAAQATETFFESRQPLTTPLRQDPSTSPAAPETRRQAEGSCA